MDPEGERGRDGPNNSSAMVPWLGVGGPFGDYAQFEQYL